MRQPEQGDLPPGRRRRLRPAFAGVGGCRRRADAAGRRREGGSSLLFRYGPAATRYTRDVDTARASDPDEYRTRLARALAAGWNGFAGRLVAVPRRVPKNVPAEYAMVPYDIKLDYHGRPWQTVRVEVGHDEIGDADEFEEFLPAELGDAFEWLGFPRPAPVRVMKLGHQVANRR